MTAALIARAKAILEQQPGYKYSPKTVEAVIAAGVVPAGAVVMGGEGCPVTMIFRGDSVEMVMDGQAFPGPKLTTQDERDAVLVQYAAHKARLGTSIGA